MLDLKINFLLNAIVQNELEMPDIWFLGGDEFLIQYLEGEDVIAPCDSSQRYTVIDLNGDISGLRFIAFRTDID